MPTVAAVSCGGSVVVVGVVAAVVAGPPSSIDDVQPPLPLGRHGDWVWDTVVGDVVVPGHTCVDGVVAAARSKQSRPPRWSLEEVEGDGYMGEAGIKLGTPGGSLGSWPPYAVCASATCAADT